MTWKAQIGSTLLIPTGTCDHLHIVCSSPMNVAGHPGGVCLLLNISSVVPKCDTTVVLGAGIHPFITHSSFVYYKKAKVEQATVLEKLVEDGTYRSQLPIGRAIVKRIVASMQNSNFPPEEMQEFADMVWDQTVW